MTQACDATSSFVFAGGGTGGHVFPLLAVANALRRQAKANIVFVGTARGIESRVLSELGERLELLDVVPIRGGGARRAARGILKAFMSLPAAHALLGRIRPRAVLSIGGYAAGPIGVAAWLRHIPVAILEPNSVLGLANRWLLPFAQRAYVAFPELEKTIGRAARRTGVPLRDGFTPAPYEARSGRFQVLVLGGSQGAAVLNDRLPAALGAARRRVPELTVLHQTGKGRDLRVRRQYEEHGSAEWAQVVPFIKDVAAALGQADLVVQRSGASAVAELCAVGRPALLVPFARAAGDHQRKNAEALEAEGAAVCLIESAASTARIEQEVVSLAHDPKRRTEMARRAAGRENPGAADAVARDLIEISGVPAGAFAAAGTSKAEEVRRV